MTVGAAGGELCLTHAPDQRESYAAILARPWRAELTGDGGFGMVGMPNGHRVNAFGAQFVEERVADTFRVVWPTRQSGPFAG